MLYTPLWDEEALISLAYPSLCRLASNEKEWPTKIQSEQTPRSYFAAGNLNNMPITPVT